MFANHALQPKVYMLPNVRSYCQVISWGSQHNVLEVINILPIVSGSNISANMGLKRPFQQVGGPVKKQVKIAPKVNILSRRTPSFNRSMPSATNCLDITLPASHTACASLSSSHGASSLDTTDLQHQLSAIKFADSGIDLGKSSSDLSSSEVPNSIERPKIEQQGLPRPKMYRHKKPRKEKQECRQDSSEKEKSIFLGQESESNLRSIVANIEKNFTSPMRILLKTPTKHKQSEGVLRTSTPCRDVPHSPGSWISPIKGLTPGSEDKLLDIDSGFLTPEAKITLGLTSCSSGKSKSSGSPTLGSLRELGLPGLTPLKTPLGGIVIGHSPDNSLNLSNQSFSKLLGEFHLDSMMEDGLAVDIANISWSALQ